MKKISMILMAFALAVTMSQCKKNEGQPTSKDEVVTITLDVTKNNGSKVVVNPSTGTVDFETGDKIYVGSGGKYVGFLTHNGTNFVGNITNPTENQPLQFYFLGNVTPQETLSAGTTEECSVIISDQTEHLPVISCAASNENYVSGVTAYSAHLLNKCALVKFYVTTPSNAAICITGMKNKVTVDFTQNTMTPSKDGDGVIMLPAGSGENVEKWAILLQQEEVDAGGLGSVYSVDGINIYSGICSAMPNIMENGYLADGIDIVLSIMHTFVDLGLPSGLLWATCNVGANTPEDYGDYFAWGETQPKSIYSMSTYTQTKYNENDGLSILQPIDDAATVIWGEYWRIPSLEECQELLQYTTNIWITQNGVNGRLFIASNGNTLFLPAAGYRNESDLYSAEGAGAYWVNSLRLDAIPVKTNYFCFDSNSVYISGSRFSWGFRWFGQTIRPVCSMH